MNEQETIQPAESRWIGTANHGFAAYAQEELKRAFGSVKSSVLVPGEVLLLTLPADAEQVLHRLQAQPLMFLRHIQPVRYDLVLEQLTEQEQQPLDALAALLLKREELYGKTIALHIRKTGDAETDDSNASELRHQLEERLAELHAEFTVQQPELIVSVLWTADRLYAGISKPEDNLSDWNGGAIRFQREEGQISRAKFKLLEAETVFGIDFTAFRRALDVGAAPGGWTSFLLEHGMHVTAVDPAKMHPSLQNHPQLKTVRRNAADVKFSAGEFDLLVCDMSWSPKLTARLVIDLLDAVQPGGTVIVTVKLMHKKPLAVIREVMESFEEARLQIQRAKQLFHNRDEITLYMVKY
ncbi:SAM-dependent methyltransferase [Paenibacillus hunanensis]|uniref:SAM-dependent methyltransferase n=1 Tax=Paenibacillus hunanensis TaxID=539262 RepID=UPI0020275A8C|nr:SAM-dependent methyltransferase [Paenibacillus hunanensis]MCL9662320.1 SAM-dependent methyltransferase [Paenibacillus hunanensis]